MALFKSAHYLIFRKKIETILDSMDVVTTILRLVRYDEYVRSAGPVMMFLKDTNSHISTQVVNLIIRQSFPAKIHSHTYCGFVEMFVKLNFGPKAHISVKT